MNIIQEWLFFQSLPKVEPGFDAHGVHFDALPVPWELGDWDHLGIAQSTAMDWTALAGSS